MNLIFEYIHYRWRANFVPKVNNETVTKIINCVQYASKPLAFEFHLNAIRKRTKKDSRLIDVADFGAGSKKLGQKRKIKEIYRQSTSSKKYQRILYHLVQEFHCENMLEMGTSLGFTSVYISLANVKGKITTLEACPQTAREAKHLFDENKYTNIELINMTFEDFFKNKQPKLWDFVFIDGHHDGKALLQYLEILKPILCENALLVLDDVRWSKGMLEAWKSLKNDKNFPLQFDLFRMGILVFSNNQSVERYRFSI